MARRPVSTGIRTTATERAQWTALAVSLGHRGLGSWLRALAYQAYTTGDNGLAMVTILTDIRRELRRIGQNLNQAVTVSNMLAKHGTAYPGLPDRVAETRATVAQSCDEISTVLSHIRP